MTAEQKSLIERFRELTRRREQPDDGDAPRALSSAAAGERAGRSRGSWLRGLAIGAVVLVVGLWLLGAIVTRYPSPTAGAELAPDEPAGTVFVDTARRLLVDQLDGLWGWLPNDVLPPSALHLLVTRIELLDNKPHFQLGVLETVRYTSLGLRDNLSRQRTTDKIDPDADVAFTLLANDPSKWIWPSAEGKYRAATQALARYRDRLGDPTDQASQFYARSDNLIQLLERYASLLGGVNTRLLAASYDPMKVNVDLAGDPEARSSTPTQGRIRGRTSWWETDDNLYFARGVAYAMLEMYRAIEIDFAPVIADKNAGPILDSIIFDFEQSQFEPWIVTNGTKGGILANHSSNLRVFLDDARQKTNSLIEILDRG